jgi:hypothetical protein
MTQHNKLGWMEIEKQTKGTDMTGSAGDSPRGIGRGDLQRYMDGMETFHSLGPRKVLSNTTRNNNTKGEGQPSLSEITTRIPPGWIGGRQPR